MGKALFILILILTAKLSNAQEISLYDREGNAFAFIAVNDESCVYLWTGKPFGYLLRANNELHIYSFQGKHLGWYDNGIVRDHDGNIAAFSKGTVTNVLLKLEELKGLKQLKPIKLTTELAPLKPLNTLYFSKVPFSLTLATPSTASSSSIPQVGKPFSSPEYVEPVDLRTLRNVLEYKQRLFDSRAEWIQEKLNFLGEISNSLLRARNRQKEYSTISSRINNVTNEMNKQPIDLADNNNFNQIVNALKRIENEIWNLYDSEPAILNELAPSQNALLGDNTKIKNSLNYTKESKAKWEEGDGDGALSLISKAIEVEPNNAYNHYFRGYIYLYGFKNYDKAINDFTNSIQMDNGKQTLAYLYRGLSYQGQKMLPQAITDYTATIKLDNNNTDAYFMRGLCKSLLGDSYGSINDYDEIIKRERTADPKLYEMATVYNNKSYSLVELNQLQKALPLVNKSLQMDNTQSYSWDTRGEIYYKLGEYQKCINDMTKAISYDKEAGNSYYYRGLAKIKLDKKTDGCKDLSIAGNYGINKAYEAIKHHCK